LRGLRVIPFTLLTGFLGSGKTTLLNQWLQGGSNAALAKTAVIINEVGDVSIDHLLTGINVSEAVEKTVVLDSGCVCCTLRVDLVHTMRELWLKRSNGVIPQFERVLLETSGLADPAPILHTLINDPHLSQHYRFDGMLTVVDSQYGARQMSRQFESVKQVAMADVLIYSKTDLVDAQTLSALQVKVKRLNPQAKALISSTEGVEVASLLNLGLYDASSKTADVRRWLGDVKKVNDYSFESVEHSHGAIRHFSISFEQPLDWEVFLEAFNMLALVAGDNLLRLKGVLDIRDASSPRVVHAVQHQLYPFIELEAWPQAWLARDEGRKNSVLVFVVRQMEPSYVRAFFDGFLT
jgi:G3E family GTPase